MWCSCTWCHLFSGAAPLNIKSPGSGGATRQTPSGPRLAVLILAFKSLLRLETWQFNFRSLPEICTGKKNHQQALCVPAITPHSILKWYTRSCWLLQALQSQHNTITDEYAGLKMDFTATVCKYSDTVCNTSIFAMVHFIDKHKQWMSYYFFLLHIHCSWVIYRNT